MDWDGVNRRKPDYDESDFKLQLIRKLDQVDNKIEHLTERVDHANNNNKQRFVFMDEEIADLKTSIQGDEAKGVVGMSSKITSFSSSLTTHITQDRWAYGIMITVLLAMLGWTVFHKV